MKQEKFDETGWDDFPSTGDSTYSPLDEETIIRIADDSFLEYDIREADSGHRSGVPHESGSAFEEFNHHE
jgi:hypothetical protein